MKEYWEAHITFYSDKELEYPSWKFSKIDGDPVLGKGVKSYLTKQFKGSIPLSDILEEMNGVTKHIFDSGCDYFRRKVERVVFDTKTISEDLLQDTLK